MTTTEAPMTTHTTTEITNGGVLHVENVVTANAERIAAERHVFRLLDQLPDTPARRDLEDAVSFLVASIEYEVTARLLAVATAMNGREAKAFVYEAGPLPPAVDGCRAG